MKTIIAGAIFIFSLLASASPAEIVYLQKITDNPILFTHVLLQNRNTRLGPHVRTTLKFKSWSPIPDSDSVIGLTESHRLYHHMQIGHDRFARLLSGSRCIKDFQIVAENGRLIALSCSSELLIYIPEKWSESPFNEIVFRRGKRALIGISVISLFSYIQNLYPAITPASLLADPYLFPLIGSMGVASIEFVRGFFDYIKSNRRPDGFFESSAYTLSLDKLRPLQLETIRTGANYVAHWNCAKLLSAAKYEIEIKDEDDIF